jgi:V/A-type H+-transporting ATPase subunit A
MKLLQREAELKDIVQLVGEDALPDSERVLLEIGRILREDYLRQSAFDDIDAYSSLKKQSAMLSIILYFADAANSAVKRGVNVSSISKMKTRADISRMKGIKDGEIEGSAKKLRGEIDQEFARLVKELEGGANENAAIPAKEKEPMKVNNAEDMKEAEKVVHDAKKATKHHEKPKGKGKKK